jgi:hypothetical protein
MPSLKSPASRPYIQPSNQLKARERKIFPLVPFFVLRLMIKKFENDPYVNFENFCPALTPLRVDIPKSHIKRYLGIKKYKCNYNECDMSFVTSNELNAHIDRHAKNQD